MLGPEETRSSRWSFKYISSVQLRKLWYVLGTHEELVNYDPKVSDLHAFQINIISTSKVFLFCTLDKGVLINFPGQTVNTRNKLSITDTNCFGVF